MSPERKQKHEKWALWSLAGSVLEVCLQNFSRLKVTPRGSSKIVKARYAGGSSLFRDMVAFVAVSFLFFSFFFFSSLKSTQGTRLPALVESQREMGA